MASTRPPAPSGDAGRPNVYCRNGKADSLDSIFQTIRRGDWLVLLDPGWKASGAEVNPPDSMVMGGWALDDGGEMGPFEPNPGYRPADTATPTDPTDTILRLVADGADMSTRIVPTLCDSIVQIGCDGHGDPLVGPAPDGILCVPIVTAEVHKEQLVAVRWIPIKGSDLVDAVPPGIDILVNPGGPVPFRLSTDTLRSAR